VWLRGGYVPAATKAYVNVTASRTVPVAVRDAPGTAAPTSPPSHFLLSFLWTFRVPRSKFPVVTPPICRPLEDVADEVTNALRRGAVREHSNGGWLTRLSHAVVRSETAWPLAAPRIARAFQASACGALPLRFSRQAPSRPRAVGGGLIPARLDYRAVRIPKLAPPMSGRDRLSVFAGLPELLFT
jgi:hypothetical protein